MSQPPNPPINLVLTLSDVNAILQHLFQGRYATVSPIVETINRQAEEQLAQLRADPAQASLIDDVDPQQPDQPTVG